MEIIQYLSIYLTSAQIYGLFFLLGTFTVAALSDIKRLSAQREFFEVWLGFILVMFVYDVFVYYQSNPDVSLNTYLLILKWVLIAVFAVLSYRKAGKLFSLARADVAAVSATAALLNPFYIVVYYIILWLTELLPYFSGYADGKMLIRFCRLCLPQR
ncbi:MAG: hypothetical protein CVU81_03420 [Euryarchaeota archaeon HGW-Euryarchaeota-1]|nr:MAG: hypothetical protein CVU81_03420 [Euryarchaeota archaeon HGW-Euryarchaeota-1]